MPRAFSARKPLERSKRPHNSAVCVNFKFDQASPPSISLLLAQPPLPLRSRSCQKAVLLIFIETFRRHVPRVLSSSFLSFSRSFDFRDIRTNLFGFFLLPDSKCSKWNERSTRDSILYSPGSRTFKNNLRSDIPPPELDQKLERDKLFDESCKAKGLFI